MSATAELSLSEVLSLRCSTRQFSETPLPFETVHSLIQIAQGKRGPSGGRAAPSAHALYPIRLIATCGNVEGTETGTYTIDPMTGHTELHCQKDLRKELRQAALSNQPWIETAPLILTFYVNSNEIRQAFAEQPPFGSRGERYAYIEAGCIAQNLALYAAEASIGSVLVAGFDDKETSTAHGVDMQPLLHMCFGIASR
ncbi:MULTISPECIES: SagB/ThcOx family dehydrogenase [unclassified Roseivivax]|uniref:SagB/ThcOx family dehydrogenase n=1 Tax=unclassified Roseivivax TaxID=2639302 RepID=UPI0012685334|nr:MULTISPECIES: SagB/ThcOx family dehydrogenase [unclassified Roseivivax]QFT48929.1 Nitroreductase family protein [Roseivivax sp. THAF40]QFT65083.1 Nitroreductase family protein [Roseivivax sp. THAF30]